MPLTTVVDYLNDRLHQLHPNARLRDQAALLDWSRQAQDQGIGLWIDRIDTPEALERAQALGAELVEGELFRAVADLRVREAS